MRCVVLDGKRADQYAADFAVGFAHGNPLHDFRLAIAKHVTVAAVGI